MEKKYVRPRVTTEARDVMDKMHEYVKGKGRSYSVISFYQRYYDTDRALTASRKSESKLRCQNALLKKKAQEYKVWTCVSILTAIAALVALTLGG